MSYLLLVLALVMAAYGAYRWLRRREIVQATVQLDAWRRGKEGAIWPLQLFDEWLQSVPADYLTDPVELASSALQAAGIFPIATGNRHGQEGRQQLLALGERLRGMWKTWIERELDRRRAEATLPAEFGNRRAG